MPQKSPPYSDVSVAHMERYLDEGLRQQLADILSQRDKLYNAASQCFQMRKLISEMDEVSALSQQQHSPLPSQTEEMKILVDLGCHFFVQCRAKTSILLMNIGCGVVLPMGHGEATEYLLKREGLLKAAAKKKTSEALRTKYQIRVVLEALMRIADANRAAGKVV